MWHHGTVAVLPELGQLGQPPLPLALGHQQAIAHVAEKFHLHDVDLLDRDTRDLGPRLVSIGIVIENCNKVSEEP